MIIKIVITIFILLELSNVLAMYFALGSKYADAVGVCNAWENRSNMPKSMTSSNISSAGLPVRN